MIGDNSKKIYKQEEGYSLVEMLVSFAVFVMLILTATSIFQAIVRSQYNAIAAQTVQESMRYALEAMSKEIRSAASSSPGCLPTQIQNKVFELHSGGSTEELFFRNKYAECVRYQVVDGRMNVGRMEDTGTWSDAYTEMPITPDEVSILTFNIDMLDDISVPAERQPKVTFVMDVEMKEGKDKQKMKIQTTISSRFYE